MKKIGEGWQYTVYDLGNGRVLKKYNSSLRSLWIILKDIIPGKLDTLFKIPKYIPDLERQAIHSIEILKRRKELPQRWFGNPSFQEDLAYEQDKAVPLGQIFADSSIEESKKIIDAFVLFTRTLIDNRIVDKFFNIAKNFGMDREGNIVLMDLGELIEDEQRILEKRNARAWAKPHKVKFIPHHELQRYFVEQMDRYFGM